MNESLKQKWIIVCAIWAGIVLLSAYNFSEINLLKEKKQKNEVIKMDSQFVSDNSETMQDIFQEEKLLYHRTDSVAVGILMVESKLRELASAFNLSDVKLESQLEKDSDSEMPLRFYLSGSVLDMLPFLLKVRDEYPYLVAKQIDWSNNQNNGSSQFSLLFIYKYALSEPGQES